MKKTMLFSFKDYKRLSSYSKTVKQELGYKILLELLIMLLYIAEAILLAKGAARILFSKEYEIGVLYFGFVIVIILIRAQIMKRAEKYTAQIAGKVKESLRNKLMDKILMLGPQYMDSTRTGRIQILLTDGVEYMEAYLVKYLPEIGVVIVTLTGIIGYLVFLDSVTALILLAVSLLAILTPFILMPVIEQANIGYWKSYAGLNAQYVDAMQGITTLKVMNAEQRKKAELYHDSEIFRKNELKNTSASLNSSAIIVFMEALGTTFAVGVAALRCGEGVLTGSVLLQILFLAAECLRPVKALNDYWHASTMGFSVAKELFAIEDEPVQIHSMDSGKKIKLTGAKIQFEKVGFRYPNQPGRFCLDNISMTLEKGKTVAVVGMSGSGKSTLASLLMRFYDPDVGRITVNGIDIKSIPLEQLYENIAMVFQNTFLFCGTVEENIRIASKNATMEEIRQAAILADADEFIQKLPNGYQTFIGERGFRLSGGQKQRIALTRAILKKAPIMILDEATSNVDTASEQAIQNTMDKISGQYTTLVIAHRLSTIRNVDCIYVVDNGKIAEQGTHQELIQYGGIYYEMVEAQSEGGIIS